MVLPSRPRPMSSSLNRHEKDRWWVKLVFGGGQYRWILLVLPLLVMYMFALYQFQSSTAAANLMMSTQTTETKLSSSSSQSSAGVGPLLKKVMEEQQKRDEKFLSKKRSISKDNNKKKQAQKENENKNIGGGDNINNNNNNNKIMQGSSSVTKKDNNNNNNNNAAKVIEAAPPGSDENTNKKITFDKNIPFQPRILKLNDQDFGLETKSTAASNTKVMNKNTPDSKKIVTNRFDKKTGGKKHSGDTAVTVEVMLTKKMKRHLEDEEYYENKMRDPLWDDECMPMQPWQEQLLSSCNQFHELGLGNFREESSSQFLKIIASGGYNQVYTVESDMGNIPMSTKDPQTNKEPVVLKILEYDTKYTDRNFDRVRRDAMITERATSSKYIVDGLGHCGFALLTPLAVHGTMADQLDELLDSGTYDDDEELKLKYILSAAFGLSDLHDLDHNGGLSAVAHDDLKMNQYMFIDGQYKLGDFNRGRFVRKNKITGEPCPFFISSNDQKYRSPHEYIKRHPLTSKIDIWALGSLIFEILTGKGVWHGYDIDETQKLIAKTNATPPLMYPYKNSTHPIHVMCRHVMYNMCFVADPNERPNAVEVANYLKEESTKLGYGHLIEEPWTVDL